MDDELDELEDRLRAVEYDHWRRNAPFLYDLELIRTLVWPSLTVQWLPGKEQDDESNFSIQQVLIGTHTSGAAQNYLTIAEVAIPVDELSEGSGGEGSGGGYVNTYQQLADKFTDALKIPHEGEINKARYMPQSSPGAFVVATKPPFPEVCVFKTDRYPTAAQLAEGAEPVEEGECNPDLRLTGHVSEGYGLAWSHLREGHLLSGSDDGSVCTWDINATPWDGRDVPALSTYLGHTEVVEDVAWHYFNPHIFGSVGDDKQLILRDTRKPADQGC